MDTYTSTRRSLHAVAESVLAGPQYSTSGTIRLRVLQGGFGTVAEPMVRVSGGVLVTPDGGRVPLVGTPEEIAASAGLTAGAPEIYGDHAALETTDTLEVDQKEAARLSSWLHTGDQALTQVAPAERRVLWPEHFDLAVTVDEVNLGVSPGDDGHPEPYAYVGPWDAAAITQADQHPFWNAAFGATLEGAPGTGVDALARFFRAGLTRVRQTRRAQTTERDG